MVEMSDAELIARLERDGVRWVNVAFLDYSGIARARAVAAAHVDRVLTRGINFSRPTVDFNAREEFPPDAAFDLSAPDVWARGDPRSYRPLGGDPGRGLLMADLVDAAGAPWLGCPRTALQRQIARASERGIAFNAGFEPEAYVFGEAGEQIRLLGPVEFAGLDGLELFPRFMEALLLELATAGLTVEQWSEEFGPGQIEVNLRYAPALESADGLVAYRHIFRDVARRHGMIGTFMPKPFE